MASVAKARTATGWAGAWGSPSVSDATGAARRAPPASWTAVTAAAVASFEEARLRDDEGGRENRRGEDEQVAERRRATTGGTGHERDPGERDPVARPGEGAGSRVPEAGGDECDEHGDCPDDHGRMAHARVRDSQVLEHDHGSIAERAGEHDARHEGGAQAATTGQREQGRGGGEACRGEPGRAEPAERELGERHGQTPQRAGGGERGDRGAVASAHVIHDRRHTLSLALSFDRLSRRRWNIWIMAFSLDLIDLRLLDELQTDADRTNVELARLIGLSAAATLHRVRRLKESGIVRSIEARLDSTAAGFPLQVYVAVTLQRHDEGSHRRFAQAVRAMPEVIAADWVTGETDAMLMVVAREVAELQRVLVRLSTRGGAARVMTLLRLEELKPSSPLPLEATPN